MDKKALTRPPNGDKTDIGLISPTAVFEALERKESISVGGENSKGSRLRFV